MDSWGLSLILIDNQSTTVDHGSSTLALLFLAPNTIPSEIHL